MEDQQGIIIQLSRAEALVLFEWLARTDEAQELTFEDSAEQTVLWKLEGQLENALIEHSEPNYEELVAAARAVVRGAPG
jgi:hypothetical protein